MLLCRSLSVLSPFSIPGEMRVQLLNQTLLDLSFYDDGPYEVADQKQLNAQLIPVPYHSYLGRTCPPYSLLLVHRSKRRLGGDHQCSAGTLRWGRQLPPACSGSCYSLEIMSG